jgi:CHAT domain-containing protein
MNYYLKLFRYSPAVIFSGFILKLYFTVCILAIAYVPVLAQQCSLISSFSCPAVVKTLPFNLNFTGSEGGLQNKSGIGTGFTTLKGMVLEDQQGVVNSIRKSGDSISLQLYEQWRSNKSFLGRQLLLPIAKRLSNLDSLQEVTNQIEQQLSRHTVSFRNLQRSQNVIAYDIAQKLQKGQAAVEFISFRLYNKKWTDSTMYAAIILLPKDSTPHFVHLFEEKQLQRLLQSSSKKINAFAVIQKLYSGDSLYQLIWKPLEKYLTNVHTIYYAPAGLLHRIAFQVLQVDPNHLLIDNYQLHQVLSTRSVVLPRQLIKKPGSAAIWANIEYGIQREAVVHPGSKASTSRIGATTSSFNFYTWDTKKLRGKDWRPLTSTKQEMESITKELLQAGIITAIDSGTVATEEAFKALDGRSPKVLHLATHGFFLPLAESKTNDNSDGNNVFIVQQNPMFRSGLVLAGANYAWKGGLAISGKEDGILTAYEIAQMDLSNTDLVVLSACETALGDLQGNEGVIGLQRAFKMAGVNQLMVSLWKVPDKETAELMKLFYRNWLGGQSTREALRSAQLKMKEKYPPPYYWAAFVLME